MSYVILCDLSENVWITLKFKKINLNVCISFDFKLYLYRNPYF